MTRRSFRATVLAILTSMLLPALAAASGAPTAHATESAAAKSSGTFAITGGGFGHGIGMSQYGAMGFALHGWSYPAILGHYYQDTGLEKVANSTVTVLLGQGGATFRGASAANGKALNPAKSYGVVVSGQKLSLISDGRSAGSFSAPLKVTGAALSVVGKGRYAGSLEFFPNGTNGVLTVNAVDLEDYVRGVVAEEMPASWPEQALEAQAVAARTYVLADTPVSSQYDVYSDTRSQMYGGISGETAATNAAESATAGEVVESGGRIIPTYFSASSGGHTESVQNVWLGVSPAPYLVGVPDPYDDSGDNPYYRWNDKLSLTTAASRLVGLYKGRFEGIKVLAHGVSPRIVSAAVIGTKGTSTVSGTTLQDDLNTMSTWMSFTTVTAKGTSSAGTGSGAAASSTSSTSAGASSPVSSSTAKSSAPTASSSTGGAGITALARMPRRVLSGTIFPASHGATVTVQLRSDGTWVRVGTAKVSSAGAYATVVSAPGVYRVLFHGVAAPAVTLR